ncbi:MAG: condensin complex protein MksE [bacterium]
MIVPKKTGEIFEVLSKGQFICSNSSDTRISKLCEILDDNQNFEILYDYFFSINFILEKGDEYYYFSRKGESKADLERKIETACKWIDIIDFFKTFENAFGSGYSFSPADIAVKISVEAVLKNKADGLKGVLRLDEKTPYLEVVNKIVDSLVKDGFAELENEILKSYKVLSSFKYLEELINNINIPDEVQHEIPE